MSAGPTESDYSVDPVRGTRSRDRTFMHNVPPTAETKMPPAPRLEVVGVSKSYPGVRALDHVSLQLHAGEVLAIVGENGAGKSTLMKVLAGIVVPDSGSLKLDGRDVAFRSPNDAMQARIALIHQELNLHEELSVAENLFLGREIHRWGWANRGLMQERAAEALRRVGCDAAPNASLASLSVASRQLVEVARAISCNAKVVIMDEPTSSLTTPEAENLFEVVQALAADSVSVIYISHRLGEIVRLADRVEVLRDGRNAGSMRGTEIHHDAMVSAMVGRETNKLFDRRQPPLADTRLVVDSLQVRHQATSNTRPVSFDVRAGEVVGIAGLVGSGRSELLEALFGLREVKSGTVRVDDKVIPSGNVRAAMAGGLALVTEDRKATGLLVQSSVRENITLASLASAPKSPWLDRKWQSSVCGSLIERLRVKTASQLTTVASLSGGNQQKVALAKWLMREPRVLLLDEPTRGVDIGAKQEIYDVLQQLSEQGLAIVFVSSEMEEVLALADRVLVLHEGSLCGELLRDEMSEEAVMRLAVGISNSGISSNHAVETCN